MPNINQVLQRLRQTKSWEKLNLLLLRAMLAVTKMFLETFIQRSVTMGSTTLLQENCETNYRDLRRTNTVICAAISMCIVLVVDQAVLYTRTSPVTYAKGNSSSYLR